MSLPVPNLDDLTFQQIVDHARKLIPFYCPEWTDHNISDPGITMVELFASMTEMLLYRVNQVPEKMYSTFLNMLGVRMAEARAAQAKITFYLSSSRLPEPQAIAAGTEVATVRTETDPAIVFTTEEELVLRPPTLSGVYNISAQSQPNNSNSWLPFDLADLKLGRHIPVFPPSLASGDMFCLALEADHSNHVLALRFSIARVSGSGVNPDAPPIEWVVWSAQANSYLPCEKEVDTTGGFSQDGEVLLYLPAMSPQQIDGRSYYLLCCRLTRVQDTTQNRYQHQPTLSSVEIEVRGGTVAARQAVVVRNEFIGESDGSAGQRFTLRNDSLLERLPDQEFLLVTRPGEPQPERWHEVRDFADAGPESKVYSLDSRTGELTLGPLLPQPEGGAKSYGAAPPRGSRLAFSQYRYGGGVRGNVPRGAIRVLKSSIPYIARVLNRSAAVGGLDAQSPAEARLLAPQKLRERTRAVTADDYEALACEIAGVYAAHCYGPGAQPGAAGELRPGQVGLALLPARPANHADTRPGLIAIEQMRASRELCDLVAGELRKRSVLGVNVIARTATLVVVRVVVRMHLRQPLNSGQRDLIRQRVEEALYGYLNPYSGGPTGKGWPFGRNLYSAELFTLLLQRTPELEYIERLELYAGDQSEAVAQIAVAHDGLICSGMHVVEIAGM
jgi:predicted phage baseplate assembly protein